MKTEQLLYSASSGWEYRINNDLTKKAQLVFFFGNRELSKKPEHIEYLKKRYPNAQIFGCCTSGEISQTDLFNEHLVCTAVWFEKTTIKATSEIITTMEES